MQRIQVLGDDGEEFKAETTAFNSSGRTGKNASRAWERKQQQSGPLDWNIERWFSPIITRDLLLIHQPCFERFFSTIYHSKHVLRKKTDYFLFLYIIDI